MTLTSVQADTIDGLIFMENDIPNTITFLTGSVIACPTGTFSAIVSIGMAERLLENGGFTIDKTINATVRILNANGTNQFTSSFLPAPQQLISHNGDVYRILQVKPQPQGTHFRIIAINNNRGI